jgi:anti-sigma B factor antagonist
MARYADDSTSKGEQSHPGRVAVSVHARGVAVVTMRGEHDLSTQPQLARAFQLAAAHSNVVVDLSECSFIDSTVIQEFIETSETVRASGEKVVLVIPPEQAQVVRIAQLAGLAQIFELHESTEGAFASLELAAATHETRVRDLRARFGDLEAYAAQCSCGWASETRTGRLGDRAARRDGLAHVEQHLPPYGHRRTLA